MNSVEPGRDRPGREKKDTAPSTIRFGPAKQFARGCVSFIGECGSNSQGLTCGPIPKDGADIDVFPEIRLFGTEQIPNFFGHCQRPCDKIWSGTVIALSNQQRQ